MRNSVRKELLEHVQDAINDRVITNDNVEEWHFYLFNEDYYLIGYKQCEDWLEEHKISPFDAIQTAQEYEMELCGEVKLYPNAENVVNMLAYVWGEELIGEAKAETIADLQEFINHNK
tara:strand:- start:208 stop:561 length:354 start_codon:yes stop_codon:yes gene_type:complete